MKTKACGAKTKSKVHSIPKIVRHKKGTCLDIICDLVHDCKEIRK